MKTASRTTCNKKERTRQIDWSKADDRALARAVVDRSNLAVSDAAWKELFKRHGQDIEQRIQRWALQTCRMLLSGEFFDEVRLAFYLSLLENDMRQLRRYDPDTGSLSTWLGMNLRRVAMVRASHRMDSPVRDVLDLAAKDLFTLNEGEHVILDEGQSGARWIGEDR